MFAPPLPFTGEGRGEGCRRKARWRALPHPALRAISRRWEKGPLLERTPMVRLNVIYTRTGDKGETGLGDGSRRSKADARVAAMGDVDETNSAHRACAAHHPRFGRAGACPDRRDARASPRTTCSTSAPTSAWRRGTTKSRAALRIATSQVEGLESAIDELNAKLAADYLPSCCRAERRPRRRCIWPAPSAGGRSGPSVALASIEGEEVGEAVLALVNCGADASVAEFVKNTWLFIKSDRPHRIAAAFTLGREDVLPGIFRGCVASLGSQLETSLPNLRYYLERHIELDEDRHAPMAIKVMHELCGNDCRRWEEASDAAEKALRARISV